jgi:hypothetical protein
MLNLKDINISKRVVWKLTNPSQLLKCDGVPYVYYTNPNTVLTTSNLVTDTFNLIIILIFNNNNLFTINK